MFSVWALHISFKTCYEISSEQLLSISSKNTIYQYCYASVISWISFQSVVSSLLHANSTIDVFFSPAVILHQLLIIWLIIL